MENTKLTKVQKFGMVLDFLKEVMEEKDFQFEGFNAEEFITNEIALVEKRNKSKAENRKPSKTQVENDKVVSLIIDFLTENVGTFFSAREIAEKMELDFSSQKMTALMKKAQEQGIEKARSTELPKLVGYGIAGE